MQPCRSEFIALRGRRYHLRIWGEDDAPALFFLHGWGDVGASFQFVVDALPPGKWRVIAPDWRGFGLSQWNEEAYWFADYIADLDALLRHYSPDEPARLAGHSMGGIVASLYAGIEPQRVAQLASLEGFVLWVHAPEDSPGRLAKWLRQIEDKDLAFRPYPDREQFAARLRNDNPRLTDQRAAFLAEHSLIARGDAGHAGYVFAADPRHRWISPVLFPLPEAKACWRRISAATLWVAGRDSTVMKAFTDRPQDYAERRACFARLQESWLPDCGHNLHHDQPEALAALLDAFFS
jgi:pimeloyl-ACP methyl ester carboxylesterase